MTENELQKAAEEHAAGVHVASVPRGWFDVAALEEATRKAFVAGAKMIRACLWKDANGDYFPQIDREVVVLTQEIPDDDIHLKVAIGHRPNKDGFEYKGDRIVPQVYGRGEWNQPNVRYWLDLDLPNAKEVKI